MTKIRDYAIQCIKDEAEAVLDLLPKLDENFDRAVELILKCKGKVYAVEHRNTVVLH